MAEKTQLEIDGRTLQVSNLDKIMFPANGFTKGQVIDYYIRISPVLLPHLKNRPITMVRFPDGIKGGHFYEKDAPSHTPSWIKRAPMRRSDGKTIRYILINDLPSLVWSANLANLEMHTLLAEYPKLTQPTMVVFDLDPGPPATAIECAQVALWLKEIFDKLRLRSFAKFSGSKGIQVYIPLNSSVTYEKTSAFSHAIANFLHQNHPEAVVSEMSKRLREGKVFIDWSQNSKSKTTVGIYSLRTKRELPYVSVPFSWDEIEKLLKKGDPDKFLVEPDEMLKRIDRFSDLFEPMLALKQSIPENFQKMLEPPTSTQRIGKSRTKATGTSLKDYNRKRDFKQTAEPPGELAESKLKNSDDQMFVIQKHEASHLHYDFRLEMQGVLRSWAVPKGIPTGTNDRRLAMHVEDHPMEYARFEGTIPKGNYGAGTVMVWDIGTYHVMEQNPVGAFYSGKLHLVLNGKKLKGEWVLVKTAKDDGRQWLLMKKGDQAKPISKKIDDSSVLTGRTMKKIASDNDAQWISNRPPTETKTSRFKSRLSQNSLSKFSQSLKSLPASKAKFVDPMLSKPVNKLPEGDEWIYEIKFDGYRAEAIRKGKDLDVISRNAKSLKRKYPEIIDAIQSLPDKDWVLDGEVVALTEEGIPSFQLLQNMTPAKQERPLHFFAFDVLHYDGKDLTNLPLFQRKEILKALLEASNGLVSFSAGIEGDAHILEQEIRKRGLEGIVAKKKQSKYEPGKRSGAWVKYKTEAGQEFVIGGYKPADRTALDSILVGFYEGNKLIYAASVRAGFTPHTRKEVESELRKLKTAKCPFANLPEDTKGRWGQGLTEADMEKCIWVKPKVVCRIDFVEWTEGDHLRHAKFVSLLKHKNPGDVLRKSS